MPSVASAASSVTGTDYRPPCTGQLLLRSRSPGSLHEGLDFVQGEATIFVRVHCFEDAFVSRLKLLQRDGPVTITVHQSEKHPHHHAGMHTPGTHHTSSAHHAGTHHT